MNNKENKISTPEDKPQTVTSKQSKNSDAATWSLFFSALINLLSRVSFFIVIIGLIGIGCLAGIFLYGSNGESAFSLIYRSTWFNTLLMILVLSLITCTLKRRGFKKSRPGILLTHLSIVMILSGAAISGWFGKEGNITLVANQEVSEFSIFPNADEHEPKKIDLGFTLQLERFEIEKHQSKIEPVIEITPPGKSRRLEIPEYWQKKNKQNFIFGNLYVQVKILAVKLKKELIPEIKKEADSGFPAIHLRSAHLPSAGIILSLPDNGTTNISNSLLVKLQPEGSDLTKSKLILDIIGRSWVKVVMYNPYRQYTLPAAEGKTIAIKKEGISLKILRYLPDFRLSGKKRMTLSKVPKNPAMQIELTYKDKKTKFWRFSRMPDFTHGINLPNIQVSMLTQLQQMQVLQFMIEDSGKIHWSLWQFGLEKLEEKILQAGESITIKSLHGKLQVLRAEAKAKVSWHLQASKNSKDISSVELEVTGLPQQKKPVLLPLSLNANATEATIGKYKIQAVLREFPGRVKSYRSLVKVKNKKGKDGDILMTHKIEVNSPLKYNGWSFHQSSYKKLTDGRLATILYVSKKPGLWLIYLGFILLVTGPLATAVSTFKKAAREKSKDA